MERTFCTSTTTILPLFFTPFRCSTQICRSKLPFLRSRRVTTTACAVFQTSPVKFGYVYPLFARRNTGAAASSADSFSSSGGGGDIKENPIAGGVDDVSPSPSDVITLDVRGMMCGGCASSVKRILENQSQVSSANVDHTTETAIVWPIPEAKVTPNWQEVIGVELAKNLTNCGFESNLRGSGKGETYANLNSIHA